MALPKEPRQKMINMMYLVLTALLALNVSAEIINAFKTVNNSLQTSNGVLNASTNLIFESFKRKLVDPANKEKAEQWYPKAQKAFELTEGVYNKIETLKKQLMEEAGANFAKKDTFFKADNLEAATRLMDNKGEGKKLYATLEQLKKDLLGIDPDINKEFASNLPIDLSMPKTENKGNKDWTSAYFRMTPSIAALTILSKFQNDVRNAQNRIVNYCHNRVGQVEIVYDKFAAIVGQSSSYLMPNQDLTIKAGIGAFSKAAQPTITIDGNPQTLNEEGLAEYTFKTGSIGPHKSHVVIKYRKPDGQEDVVERDIEYEVGAPTGAFVSAEKVKVLYIDLPNELKVSGGNVGDEKVQVKTDNGTVTKKGPGTWLAEPATPGKATITVIADGKVTPFEFKVKTVPDPQAMVGRNKGGPISTAEFKAQSGVRAELENFVFDGVSFTVTSFTLICNGGQNFKDGAGIRPGVAGNSFDPVRDLINRCSPGTTVAIDDIYASGPGGRRKLPPIVFYLR